MKKLHFIYIQSINVNMSRNVTHRCAQWRNSYLFLKYVTCSLVSHTFVAVSPF